MKEQFEKLTYGEMVALVVRCRDRFSNPEGTIRSIVQRSIWDPYEKGAISFDEHTDHGIKGGDLDGNGRTRT